MPGRKKKAASPSIPSVEEAAKKNPKIDVEKVREAQKLLEDLRKAGVCPEGYQITSPYERRPLEAWRDVVGTEKVAR